MSVPGDLQTLVVLRDRPGHHLDLVTGGQLLRSDVGGRGQGQRDGGHGPGGCNPIRGAPAKHVGAGDPPELVALGVRQDVEHLIDGRRAAGLVHEVGGVGRQAQDQAGLQPRDVVEVPPAAGVHQQGRSLHLEEQAGAVAGLLATIQQSARPELGQQPLHLGQWRVDHLAVSVAGTPGIDEELGRRPLVEVSRRRLQGIHRGPQGRAPGLVPPILGRHHGAAAIAPPATDPVRAAPGGALAVRSLGQRHLPGGRMGRQKGAEVGGLDAVLRALDEVGEGQIQIGELLVMSEELAVRGAQHQRLPRDP